MATNKPLINVPNALHKLSKDQRDFSLAGIFDQIKIEQVPLEDFIVAVPLRIKQQDETDYCTGYAVTEASEDQEGEELLPEYQFFKTKLLMNNFDEWGADLRMACKSAVRFGSLPLKGFESYKRFPRQEVLNPARWPASLDDIAKRYKKETFFKVDGRYDIFDNIRCALWQHRDEKRSIVVGAAWKQTWTEAAGGIIPKEKTEDEGFGHAFKIYGQMMISGEPYLIAQLSNGTEIGDNGIFYFPRNVVNADLGPYGQFMFKDIPREVVEYYKEKNIKHTSSWFRKLICKIF